MSIGVMIHSATKIRMIAIYNPFCKRNARRLKVYL